MKATYKHTNIISSDWTSLARFYQEVFGCIPVPPVRNLSGNWLDKGTGIKDARITGMLLRLPGFGHMAFEAENVQDAVVEVLQNGGCKTGEIASAEIEGFGQITFVYVADPEGNIIELQGWK